MQKILLIGAFVAISCLLMAQGPVKNYQNPVVNYSLPDPSVIKGEDGYYYLYATEDIRNLPIHRSKDLVSGSMWVLPLPKALVRILKLKEGSGLLISIK